MERLTFVGGMPYSGKSTLCERLVESDPSRYKHIEIDALFDEVGRKGEPFFKYLQIINPEAHKGLKVLAVKDGLFDPDKQVFNIGRTMVEGGGQDNWWSLLQNVALCYGMDIARNHGNPIFEGLFANRDERAAEIYRLMQEISSKLPDSPNLDDIDKSIIFMNFGKELSLERFRQGRAKQYSLLQVSEPYIMKIAEKQEVPSEGEFPNFHVHVISSDEDLEDCLKELSIDNVKIANE